MTRATATANFRTELTSAQGAPEWVELFPAGPTLTARDGRVWIANPSGVIAAFLNNRAPLPIDYEHGQDHLAAKGHEAPAAGWIVELEDRGGAVWGKVEWTDRAAGMIAAREYRFLSPSFVVEKPSGRVMKLEGAGLVNRPALEMTALSREQSPTEEEETMKQIASALGLAETSDEAGILARLTQQASERTALCSALKLDATADNTAVLAAIASLQERAAVDTTGAVAELAAVKTSLETATARIAELETAGHAREVAAALDEAQAAGKITPATRETYAGMCSDAAGLQRFRELAAKLPKIAEPSSLGAAAGTDAGEMSAHELAAKASAYQREQHAAGNMISTTAAVLHVKETVK